MRSSDTPPPTARQSPRFPSVRRRILVSILARARGSASRANQRRYSRCCRTSIANLVTSRIHLASNYAADDAAGHSDPSWALGWNLAGVRLLPIRPGHRRR